MSAIVTTRVKSEPRVGDRRFKAVTRAAPQLAPRLNASTASTPVPTRRCPVCFRAACPLKSHKQYARSTGLGGRTIASNKRQSSSVISTSSSEGSLESYERVHHRLREIGATKIDSFVDFPLPKGVTAEVHQLFQDCKPTSFGLDGCSFLFGHELSLLSNDSASDAHPRDTG
jgi:hypothetical protein